MGGAFSFSTLQATYAETKDCSALSVPYLVNGIGVGLYAGVGGDVEIVTLGGDTAIFTAVPAGTFMQVPLFSYIGTNTADSALTIMTTKAPFK